MVRSISSNNNHNMSNFINIFLNFKLKLNTHRTSNQRNSWGLLLPTTPSTKPFNQFQKWWLAAVGDGGGGGGADSDGNSAAQLQSYSLDPPEYDGGARFSKISSEIGNPAKSTKTELFGQFSGESRRFPATNQSSNCSSRWELSNGTKHVSNGRRMRKLWAIEVLNKFEKINFRGERGSVRKWRERRERGWRRRRRRKGKREKEKKNRKRYNVV